MLEITWDTTGEPTLAVGRGAPYVEEASHWVIENAQPMIYEQGNGWWVFIHGPTGGIEAWQRVTSQAEAASRARRILAPGEQAAT